VAERVGEWIVTGGGFMSVKAFDGQQRCPLRTLHDVLSAAVTLASNGGPRP